MVAFPGQELNPADETFGRLRSPLPQRIIHDQQMSSRFHYPLNFIQYGMSIIPPRFVQGKGDHGKIKGLALEISGPRIPQKTIRRIHPSFRYLQHRFGEIDAHDVKTIFFQQA